MEITAKKPLVAAIAAIGKQRELGKDNDLIWRIPADLGRLKALTTGQAIVMGRKTYESIGRPLPNRLNIVISTNPAYGAPGCTTVSSLEAAFEAAEDLDEIYIFGGAIIYELALPYIEKLYLTHIHATDSEADTFFPEFTDTFTATIEHPVEAHAGLEYQWIDYERKSL